MATKQEQLTAQINERSILVARNASISANTVARQAYVAQMIAQGNYAEANKVAGQIEQDEAEKAGNAAKITNLNASIAGLQASIDADTALQNANANLTPDQLTQLQINQQNTEAQIAQTEAQAAGAAAAAAAAAGVETAKQNFAAANTKYYIIAAVVIVIIIGAIIIISRRKGKTATIAPPMLAAA